MNSIVQIKAALTVKKLPFLDRLLEYHFKSLSSFIQLQWTLKTESCYLFLCTVWIQWVKDNTKTTLMHEKDHSILN